MMSLKREIVGEIVVIVVIDTMLVGFFGAPRWGSHLIPLQQLWPAAGNVLTAGPLFVLFHLGLAGHGWFWQRPRFYRRIIGIMEREMVSQAMKGYVDPNLRDARDKLRAKSQNVD
jgi:hypothetical protein